MARAFLPKILPGLLGVFMAALVASVMSSCDSFMVASSALFTENIYKVRLPGKSQKHYVVVGRITALLVVAGGLCVAYSIESVVRGLETFWKLAPMMGVAFWLGVFWRRATAAGAWAATLASIAVLVLTSLGPVVGVLDRLQWGLTATGDHGLEVWLPLQMVAYLSAGALAGIAASLLTRPPDAKKLERFHALARTPVRKGEGVPEVPSTIPPGVEVPPKRLLARIGSVEIPAPGTVSIVGFAASCAAGVAMIAGFYWFTR
jgi:Na+/proline symporter